MPARRSTWKPRQPRARRPQTPGRSDNSSSQSLQRLGYAEPLEKRVLLTTLVGGGIDPNTGLGAVGDVFEFQQSTDSTFSPGTAGGTTGQLIRVAVGGNTILEITGTTVDGNNNISLNDIPGHFNSSAIGRGGADFGGGIGGADGIELIGPTLTAATTFNLAANALGDVYAVGIIPAAAAAGGTRVVLLRFNTKVGVPNNLISQLAGIIGNGNATVVFDITSQLPIDPSPPPATTAGQSTITSVSGADFDPTTGLLYFVAVDNTPTITITNGQPTVVPGTPIPRLYSIDVTTGVVNSITGSFGVVGAVNFTDPQSLTFDDSGTLWTVLPPRANAPAAPVPTDTLFQVSKTNSGVLTNPVRITEAGGPVLGITGIEFIPGDNNHVIASQVGGGGGGGAAAARLLSIDLTTGFVTELGPLPDPQAAGQTPQRGADIEGITWDPTYFNTFTGGVGALLGVDAATNELVEIDTSNRAPFTTIFNIHVTKADATSYVAIAEVPDLTVQVRPMEPFQDSAGDFRVFNAQDGMDLVVAAPAGTGGVLIGAKTRDITPQTPGPNPPEDLRLILDQQQLSRFGVLAVGDGRLNAGVSSSFDLTDFYSQATDIAQRLLGSNLDQVKALSVSAAGTIALIDTDSRDALGRPLFTVNPLTGVQTPQDQIAIIDRTTGQAVNLGLVKSLATGEALSHVQAMDWGDPGGTGAEQLFAVYRTANGQLTYGTIDADPASATFGGFTPINPVGGGTINAVQAMSFSPTGQLYAVDGANNLLLLNGVNGTFVRTIGHVNSGAIGSMDFDTLPTLPSGQANPDFGRLFAHEVTNGFLMNIDINTAQAGTVTATEPNSLPPTVGAISFDLVGKRYIGVDNATGEMPLRQFEAPQFGGANAGIESSMLVVLRGTTSTSAVPTDVSKLLIGGTLTGTVNLSGNSDIFYAGWIITGGMGWAGATYATNVFGQPSVQHIPFPGQRGGNGPTLLNQGDNGVLSLPDNFVVDGDIRSLLSLASIGTDALPGGTSVEKPTFLSGFQLTVGGAVGQVRSGGDFAGSFDVFNFPDTVHEFSNVQEVEGISQGPSPLQNRAGVNFQAGFLDNPTFFNDSFNNAQYLGAIAGIGDASFNGGFVSVDGALIKGAPNVDDRIDYYAVELMAGQTVTVQLTDLGVGMVGVFDPDGRLIATNMNDVNLAATLNAPFQFTADRPGAYRFAVGFTDDTVLSGTLITALTGAGLPDNDTYILTISNIGTLAVGGVIASAGTGGIPAGGINALGGSGGNLPPGAGSVYDVAFGDSGFRVENGDLGAIRADDTYASKNVPALDTTVTTGDALVGTSVVVANGNLRTVEAGSIGVLAAVGVGGTLGASTVGAFGDGLNIDVPNGSVGLISATLGTGQTGASGLPGILVLNLPISGLLGLQTSPRPGQPQATIPSVAASMSVGGNFQVIDGNSTVYATALAKGGLGDLRAGDMGTTAPSIILVNTDGVGSDGIVDLIDCFGQMGVLGAGPIIMTGPGGDVRYIRNTVGPIFRDPFFGGNAGEETIEDPGVPVTIRDDGGAQITITPMGPTFANPTFDPTQPPVGTNTQLLGPQITNLLTYPIRGSGGSVIVSADILSPTVTVTTGGTGTGGTGGTTSTINPVVGVTIDVKGGGGSGAAAEIGRLNVEGIGTRVLTHVDGSLTLAPSAQPSAGGTPGTTQPIDQPLDLIINGDVPVDVLSLIVTQVDGTTLGYASSVQNNSPNGEIVELLAGGVGTLSSRGTLGLAKNHTGAEMNPDETVTISNALNVPAGSIRPDRAAAQGAHNSFQSTGRAITNGVVTNPGFTLHDVAYAANVGDAYPFSAQKHAITIDGDVITMTAGKGLGNIIVNGAIGTLQPNADGVDSPGEFEGINAPVYAVSDLGTAQNYTAPFQFTNTTTGGGTGTGTGANAAVNTTSLPSIPGRLINVNIGEGVLPSGTGTVAPSGLFGTNAIQSVTNSGLGSDIRGDIITTTEVDGPLTAIGTISLHDGAIINSNIFNASDVWMASEIAPARSITQTVPTNSPNNTSFDIRQITLSGAGGIIGTSIAGADIGPVTVHGFGVFNSAWDSLGDGRIAKVSADGYGIRGTFFIGGASMDGLFANGSGELIPTNAFTPSVRESESFQFDPYFGTPPNVLTDLHATLGTSAATPVIPGVTDAGVLEDDIAQGSRDFGTASAWRIRTSDPSLVPVRNSLVTFPTQIAFGNSVKNIITHNGNGPGLIDGLQITTGQLGNFAPASDVLRTEITVSGRVKKFTVPGSFATESRLEAVGPNASLGKVTIGGNLDGEIFSDGPIDSITVGHNVTGDLTIGGSTHGKFSVGKFIVGGALTNGSLTINGNANQVKFLGPVGQPGDVLTVNGSLNSLIVGGNLQTSLNIHGNLGKMQVGASILSGVAIDVDNVFNSLQVNGDVQSGVSVRARVLKKRVVRGQDLGSYNIG